MPRNSGTAVEQNFVNGLVTEATAMNFPENACTSASNVVFKETGEVVRRFGYDYERAYQLNSITKYRSAVVEFEWRAAGGHGNINFCVQQIGDTIRFYRIREDSSLSSQIHATTLSLNTYRVDGSSPVPSEEPCSFSSGKGYLFVTNKYCHPFYVSYEDTTNSFTATQITIEVRDFEGLDDGYGIEETPGSLTESHEYNLLNQGWDDTVENVGGGSTVQPIDEFFTKKAVYPSNAMQWWVFKNSSEQFDPNTRGFAFGEGNSLAPRGHYILNWFNTDRSGASSRITTVTERTAGYYRPTSCAFFAGRIWYAGVEASAYSGEVYYSQIIERDEQIGQCYQANDPSSEILSDLLDTDGGVVKILDMGTVYKMFASQKALLIFASNGIWAVSGTDNSAFKATDYSITKVSAVTVSSGLSFVDVQGTPVFWNADGIWAVSFSQGSFVVESISDERIKQYLKDIPDESKKWVKGAYNSVDRTIQWLFRSTTPSTFDERYTYDSILTFNTTTKAFYPWTIYSTTKTVNGILAVTGPAYNSYNTVVDGSDTVVEGSATVIEITDSDTSSFKYFVTKNTSGSTYDSTFAVCDNTTYLDWVEDSESYNYTSSFISGYRVHGEGNKEYQANYVTFILSDETSSSAFVQGLWDFSNNSSSKKWTTAQQIYNSTPTYRDYRIRKVKIRGWGKALQFKIYSAQGAPFSVVGWSAFETSNVVP